MSDRYEMVNDLCPIAHLPAGHIADKLIELGYVKQHRGTWIDLGDQRCQCSQCGSVRYGNSKEAIENTTSLRSVRSVGRFYAVNNYSSKDVITAHD